MAMTLPQRKTSDAIAFDAPHALERENPEGDRGPANAVIAKLAQAIADQNATNLTVPVAGDTPKRGWPELRPIATLVLGSATLWIVIILAISALL